MKNSFTLLETIFSLTIITIVVSSMFNLISKHISNDRYNDIQDAKNQFIINSSKTSYHSNYIILERKVIP